MVQAALLDGHFLDLFSPFNDGCVAPKVGVGGCDVAKALVVAVVESTRKGEPASEASGV